jgi:hypothetical protein
VPTLSSAACGVRGTRRLSGEDVARTHIAILESRVLPPPLRGGPGPPGCGAAMAVGPIVSFLSLGSEVVGAVRLAAATPRRAQSTAIAPRESVRSHGCSGLVAAACVSTVQGASPETPCRGESSLVTSLANIIPRRRGISARKPFLAGSNDDK